MTTDDLTPQAQLPLRPLSLPSPAIPRAGEIGKDRGLVLIGYRGSGKSTLGRELAARLGCGFIDSDTQVETLTGRKIPEIFASDGETAFRDFESLVIAQCTQGPSCVLATGGGVILRTENRQHLKNFGLVVWLQTAPEVLRRRLEQSAKRDAAQGKALRPALTTLGTLGEIEQVLAQRAPWYFATADLIVETSHRSPDEVLRVILDACRSSREKSYRPAKTPPSGLSRPKDEPA